MPEKMNGKQNAKPPFWPSKYQVLGLIFGAMGPSCLFFSAFAIAEWINLESQPESSPLAMLLIMFLIPVGAAVGLNIGERIQRKINRDD